MDLAELYGGSFINWEVVGGSWTKKTVPSRLLLFAARRYLKECGETALREERAEAIGETPLPEEVKLAFSRPPEEYVPGRASVRWGEFVDAALAVEMEMVSYGERPPLLGELKSGLEQAAEESGAGSEMGRWFRARQDALPGTDLPEDSGYLPV
ncbi:MAG: hypothetical protein ACR2GU_08495 [Rubrobacteraceae bacterium]